MNPGEQRVFDLYHDILGNDLQAAVPFYGGAPDAARVWAIEAPLLIHYAENDERVNAMWPGYEAALRSARLAWERTIAFFEKQLA